MTVFFALIIVTSFFVLLSNFQEIRDTKNELRNFNLLIDKIDDLGSLNNIDKQNFKDIKINNVAVRFTLLDGAGAVLYDTENELESNYKEHIEFKQAMENGEGSSTKYSDDYNLNSIYYSTKLNDNLIIVSSVPVNMVKTFQNKNIKYCIGIITVVMFFSICSL